MALTPNLLLASGDYIQKSIVLSNDTAMVAGFPLTNVTLPDLYKPAIFNQAPNTIQTFCFDLGSIKILNLIALLKHTINNAGKWRVYLNAALPDTLGREYDSGWKVVRPVAPAFGLIPWGEFLWGDVAPQYDTGLYNQHAYMPLPATVAARYVTISIDARSNSVPLKFYRCWASGAYQPSVNIAYGADVTIIDETKVVQATSGTRQYGDRVQRRQLNFGFDMLPRSEMLFNVLDQFVLANGISVPVIAMLEPTDPYNFTVEAVYGNLLQLEKTSYASWGQWANNIGVEEAV